MIFDEAEILRALRKSWSPKTARQWREDNPALGQCNVTALVVHDLFGGQILQTQAPGGAHFYNWRQGRRFDFTSGQFDAPLRYADLDASTDDVRRGANDSEYETLKTSFLSHYDGIPS